MVCCLLWGPRGIVLQSVQWLRQRHAERLRLHGLYSERFGGRPVPFSDCEDTMPVMIPWLWCGRLGAGVGDAVVMTLVIPVMPTM